MKSNAMKVFLVNLVLCIVGVNGVLLLKSTIGHIPFRFNLYWGLVTPILCATVSAISTAVKCSNRACQK